jgi:hypothetical protein
MPRIPDNYTAPGLSLDVPTAQGPEGAGLVEGAAGQFADTMEKIGQDALLKYKKVEAVTAVSTAMIDDDMASKEYEQELRMKYPTGFVTGANGDRLKNEKNEDISTSDYYKDWLNTRYHEQQAKMPSELAQIEYQTRAGDRLADKYSLMKSDELTVKIKALEAANIRNIERSGNELLSRPSVEGYYARKDEIIGTMRAGVGTVHNEVQFSEMAKKAQTELSNKLFQGFYDQALEKPKKFVPLRDANGKIVKDASGKPKMVNSRTASIDDALALLNTPGTPADALNPDDKNRIMRDFLHLRGEAAQRDKGDAEDGLRMTLEALERGGLTAEQKRIGIADANFAKDEVTTNADGSIDVNKRERLQTNIALAPVIGDRNSDAAYVFGSPQQRAARDAYAVDEAVKSSKVPGALSLVSKGSSAALAQKLSHHNKEITTAQNADSVGFIEARSSMRRPEHTAILALGQTLRNPNLTTALSGENASVLFQAGMKQTNQANAQMRTANPRVFSKTTSEALANNLQSGSVEEINYKVLALRNTAKDHFPRVISQMIADKKLSEKWLAAAVLANDTTPAENKTMINYIVNGKTIDELYQKMSPQAFKETTRDEMESQIANAYRPWATSLLRGSLGSSVMMEQINSLTDAYITETKFRLTNAKDPDAKSAVSAALVRLQSHWAKVGDGELYLPRNFKLPTGVTSGYTDTDVAKIDLFLRDKKITGSFRAFDEKMPGFENQIAKSFWVYTVNKEGQWGVALQIPGRFAGVEGVEYLRALNKPANKSEIPTPVFYTLPELRRKAAEHYLKVNTKKASQEKSKTESMAEVLP